MFILCGKTRALIRYGSAIAGSTFNARFAGTTDANSETTSKERHEKESKWVKCFDIEQLA